jgi:hypothetical protein
MLFQNLFPPFPGLFPFPDFFELKNKNINANTVNNMKKHKHGRMRYLRKTLGCFKNAFSVYRR